MSERDLTVKVGIPTIAFALPMWIWIAAIFVVSSIPGPALAAVGITVWDKLAHFFEYAVLGFLALRHQRCAVARSPQSSLVRVALLGVLVGSVDECYQYLIPGRSTDAADLVADVLGALAGAALGLLYLKAAGKAADRGGRLNEGA